MCVAFGSPLEGSHEIESPYHEWLGDGDHPQGVSWEVHLFGIELAPLALADKVYNIGNSYWPIETL